MLKTGESVIVTFAGDSAQLFRSIIKDTKEERIGVVHKNAVGFWVSPSGRKYSNPIPAGFEVLERKIQDPCIPSEEWETPEQHQKIIILNKTRYHS